MFRLQCQPRTTSVTAHPASQLQTLDERVQEVPWEKYPYCQEVQEAQVKKYQYYLKVQEVPVQNGRFFE